MLNRFLFVVFAFMTSLSWGQYYTTATYIEPLLESSCENTVYIDGMNIGPHDIIQVSRTTPLASVYIVEVGDTVHGFCNEMLGAIGEDTIDIVKTWPSNGYARLLNLAQTYGAGNQLNFEILSYIEPTSTSSANGEITFYFPNADLLMDYTYNFTYSGSIEWINEASTFRLYNLSAGPIEIWLDGLNPYDYLWMRMYIGDPHDLMLETGLDVSLSWSHANGNCEGFIVNQPLNITNYHYNIWEDYEIQGVNLRTGLCPGVYSVYNMDRTAAAEILAGKIDTIVITDDYYTYIDTNLMSYAPNDTIWYFQHSCDFNFDEGIDSVVYVEDTLFSYVDSVIVDFQLMLYQDGQYIVVQDTITIGDSLVLIDAVIYCDPEINGSKSSSFRSQRIMFLRGVDDHGWYSEAMEAGLFELNEHPITLFPNPGKEEFTIESEVPITSIEMFDLYGNRIEIENQNNRIVTTSFAKGIYIVCIITEDNRIQTMKWMKE